MKTILITGATDGIGKQTALALAKTGARIILHGRNSGTIGSAEADIRRVVPDAQLEGIAADFSSLKQVRSMAQQILSTYARLDVLINNAGVYMKHRALTEDGFEMTFGVNHLAHFLLTNLLLDLLKASAPARIITVSSMVHAGAVLDFENLQAEKSFNPHGAYALSKLANVLVSTELARRLEGTSVTSNVLHPGVIGTKMLRAAFNMSGARVESGAATSVYLAVAPEVENTTGKYYSDRKIVRASPLAGDPEMRRRLWEASAAMVGL